MFWYIACMAKWCKVNPWISTLCSPSWWFFLVASFLLVLVRAFCSKSCTKLMKHSFHLPPSPFILGQPMGISPERLKKSHPTNSLNNHPWRRSRCNQHGWNARRVLFFGFAWVVAMKMSWIYVSLCLWEQRMDHREHSKGPSIFCWLSICEATWHASHVKHFFAVGTLTRHTAAWTAAAQRFITTGAYPLKFVGWWCLRMVGLIQVEYIIYIYSSNWNEIYFYWNLNRND